MERPVITDVLASRYASTPMVIVWSNEEKIARERGLWIVALRAEMRIGKIKEEDVQAYEATKHVINLDSIRARELKLRQDVKARIEEFNALTSSYAGRELQLIHEGFTSRDVTDNVEQWQTRTSLLMVRDRTVAVLARLGHKAKEFQLLNLAGRSHNVPGQTITFGKRFANVAQELLLAFEGIEDLVRRYPLRGIKGAMGTQQDILYRLRRTGNVELLEREVQRHLGFPTLLESTGQVYPRSLDFAVVSALVQLAAAPANFALMVRLMAGHQLLHEGFGPDQTGSTAMPHKMNTRTCERITALKAALVGYLAMVAEISGNQWLEGDVSCSAVRRIALPGAFMALDGIYESMLTVLDEMEVFPGMIEGELTRFLHFLSSTRLLMAALDKGMGREEAHAIIKRHAVGVLKKGSLDGFLEALADDREFPLALDEIRALVESPNHGLAPLQIDKISRRIADIVAAYPKAAQYVPEPIL